MTPPAVFAIILLSKKEKVKFMSKATRPFAPASLALALCGFSLSSMAEINYSLKDSSVVNWKGASGGYWNNSSNWDGNNGYIPCAEEWKNLYFDVLSPTTVNIGDKVDGATHNSQNPGAFALIIKNNSGQVIFEYGTQSDSTRAEKIQLYGTGSGTSSFVNLSDAHTIFNVIVGMHSYRDGASGINPGAEFNEEFNVGNWGASASFKFFSGDAKNGSDNINTTIFRKEFVYKKNGAAVVIDSNHIVKCEGANSFFQATGANLTVAGKLEVDGGTVNVASLATADNGTIILKGATVNADTLPAGTTIGTGLTTLNYGDADITLGTITFADGGKLKLNGTGNVTLADGSVVPGKVVLPLGDFVYAEGLNNNKYYWCGVDNASWRLASNWTDSNGNHPEISNVCGTGTSIISGYAVYTNSTDMTIKGESQSGTIWHMGASGIIVEEGAGKLTVYPGDWYSSKLQLSKDSCSTADESAARRYASIVNLSSNMLEIKIPVEWTGSGNAAILPGVKFAGPGDNGVVCDANLVFLKGNSELGDARNTTTFSSNAKIGSRNDQSKADMIVCSDHIVELNNPLTVQGNVEVSGKVVIKNNATFTYGNTFDSTLTVKTGGELKIEKSSLTLPKSANIEACGKLTYGNNALSLAEGAALTLSGATVNATSLPDAIIGDGTTTLSAGSGAVTLSNTLSGTGTLKVTTTGSLTLSSAVSGSVSLDCTGVPSLSFASGFEWTSTGTLTLPDGTVVARGECSKMVGQINNLPVGTSYAATEVWSQPGVIGSDSTTHYICNGSEFRTPEDSPLAFPAAAKATLSNNARFSLKSSNLTIANLTLCSGTAFDCANDNWACAVNGDIEISTNHSNSAVTFTVEGTCTINANLTGHGNVAFAKRASDKNPATFNLNGENTFAGTVEIKDGSTVNITNANNLAAENAQSKIVLNGGTLKGGDKSITFGSSSSTWGGLKVTANSSIGFAMWGTTMTIYGPVEFAEGVILSRSGNGTFLFPDAAMSDFEGHLASGLHAILTSGGVKVSADTKYTEDAAELTPLAWTTIYASDTGVNRGLFAWLTNESNGLSLDTAAGVSAANTYLQTKGEANITGLEAYMLGYESRPTVEPRLTVTVEEGDFVLTFDGNEPKAVSGISLVYKVESSDDPSFPSGEGTVVTTLSDRKLSPESAKTYNRLRAEVSKAE